MKTKGNIKPVQVNVPEALHQAASVKARTMGITIADGYADALERWVAADDPLQGFTVAQLRSLRSFFSEPQGISDKLFVSTLQQILETKYS